MSGASSRKWATNEKAHACKAARFAAMRDHALRINSIAPRPPPRPSDRILMSFLLKPDTDKRQLLVPPAVLVAIRNGFPQIDVELHTAMLEDEVVQLDWLSRTDILVTNVGSASFRMIYLPDGAQVRRVHAQVSHTHTCVRWHVRAATGSALAIGAVAALQGT